MEVWDPCVFSGLRTSISLLLSFRYTSCCCFHASVYILKPNIKFCSTPATPPQLCYRIISRQHTQDSRTPLLRLWGLIVPEAFRYKTIQWLPHQQLLARTYRIICHMYYGLFTVEWTITTRYFVNHPEQQHKQGESWRSIEFRLIDRWTITPCRPLGTINKRA